MILTKYFEVSVVFPVLASSPLLLRVTDEDAGARNQIAKFAAFNECSGGLIVSGRGDGHGLAADEKYGEGRHSRESRQGRREGRCVHWISQNVNTRKWMWREATYL